MNFKNLIKEQGANRILNILFDDLRNLIIEKLKQNNNKFYFKTNQDYDIDYLETEDLSFLTVVNEYDLPRLNNLSERIAVTGVELVKEEEEHILYLTKCLNTGKNNKTFMCLEIETLINIYDLMCKQEK